MSSARLPLPKIRRPKSDVIPLHACSKEEIKICAILSRGLIGDDYDEFRAGHACKLLNGLQQPDFVYGKYIFQYDSHYFHDGDPAVERDMRVNQRHIQAGYSVIRLRDRLPPLPTCDGLTCVAMNAADRHLTSVYAWARLALPCRCRRHRAKRS